MLAASSYTWVVRRPYPPFLQSLILGGYATQSGQGLFITPFHYRNIVVCDGDWYYSSAEQRELGQIVFQSWTRPDGLRQAIQWFRGRERALIRAAHGTSLSRYADAYEAYMPALSSVQVIDDALLRNLRLQLEKHLDPQTVSALLDTLNLPFKLNEYRREERDLALTNNIRRHVQMYDWIHSRYGLRRPYTVTQALKKQRRVVARDVVAEIRRQQSTVRNAIRRAKSVLNAEHRVLVDLMQFIVYYRTQRTDMMNKSTYLFGPHLQRYARGLKLSYRDLLFSTRQELEERKIHRHLIDVRQDGFACILEPRGLTTVTGSELRSVKQHFATLRSVTSSVQGTTASPGLIRGVARIIHGSQDFTKLKRGEILVASMTTPEFVPIMRRAGAFVTDEGGMTCHAAIVAREMKKPCVIGTKVATKVLKDGDRVEVDATRGIVKKL